MKCPNCNHVTSRESKFCPNCGEKIVVQRKSAQADKSAFPAPGYSIGLLALGILIGFAIFKLSSTPATQTVAPPAPQAAPFQGTVTQSAAVIDIAKDFMCPCGKCNDALDVCSCDHPKGAYEVKGFIAQKLQEGHEKPHIVELLHQQYPGLQSKIN